MPALSLVWLQNNVVRIVRMMLHCTRWLRQREGCRSIFTNLIIVKSFVDFDELIDGNVLKGLSGIGRRPVDFEFRDRGRRA